MPTVLIPHVHTKYDPISKQRVATIDLTEAQEYGELEVVTSGDVNVPDGVNQLYDRIMDGEFTASDYILAIGDPLLIGAALSYAAEKIGGPVTVLRWNRFGKHYETVEFNL